ncbi:MAG: type II secretion system protein GspG [Phycisphaeraceae bacterium]|nr:type II secretion system protein GspG [Phycisphaeraceae bacterium]MCW5753337.1 type II secretion system protein GspG [Phycisphaeraceae bacterium]
MHAQEMGRGARVGLRRGFTLIEVMIVIGIILAIGGIVGVALFQQREDSKIKLTQQDMNTLKSGIAFFFQEFDRVPTTEEGLSVLWAKANLDNPDDEVRWRAALQKPLVNDRWNREWVYEQLTRTSYQITSVGPDGEEGSDDDIVMRENVLPTGEDDDLDGGWNLTDSLGPGSRR